MSLVHSLIRKQAGPAESPHFLQQRAYLLREDRSRAVARGDKPLSLPSGLQSCIVSSRSRSSEGFRSTSGCQLPVLCPVPRLLRLVPFAAEPCGARSSGCQQEGDSPGAGPRAAPWRAAEMPLTRKTAICLKWTCFINAKRNRL